MADQLSALDDDVQRLHDLHQNGEIGEAYLLKAMKAIIDQVPHLRVEFELVRRTLRKWFDLGAISQEQLQTTNETILDASRRCSSHV